MSINSSLMRSVDKIGISSMPSITTGKIMEVNKDKLTASVYVPDKATTLSDIPICFPSRGAGYGSYFMPSVGESCLLLKTESGRIFILSATSVGGGDTTGIEKILPGENTVQAESGAFLRQDAAGNFYISSGFSNSIVVGSDGVNRFYSTGKQELTASKKDISGFAVNVHDIIKDKTHSINGNTVKTIDYQEYVSSITLPAIYSPSDILKTENEVTEVDITIKDSILQNARDILSKVDDFYTTVNDFSDSIKNANLTPSQLAAKVTELHSNLYSKFGTDRKAIMVIEKGNAIGKNLDSINDIADLVDADFEQSPRGADICFRLTVRNPQTNDINARVYLDAAGNLHVKSKSFIVETEEFEVTEI